MVEAAPLVNFSNSPLMSRKSRWRFFSTEQASQYHLGLTSALGESRSYTRPKKSWPSEIFMSGTSAAPHPSHLPAEGAAALASSIIPNPPKAIKSYTKARKGVYCDLRLYRRK